MTLFGLAIFLFVAWIVFVGLVHVTAFAIHLLLIAAIIAVAVALINRARSAS